MAMVKMKQNRLTAQSLAVRYFLEGGMYVAHCGVLDMSSCGRTLAEARANIREAIGLFFEECIARGTLEAALLACGWERTRGRGGVRLRPPSLVREENVPLPVAV